MAHNNQHTQFNTMGVVCDLHDREGRKFAQETLRQTGDTEFRNVLSMAKALEKRYVVAAGKFNGTGMFATLCDDSENLIVSFAMANAWINEFGPSTTGWLIKPDACATLLCDSLKQGEAASCK